MSDLRKQVEECLALIAKAEPLPWEFEDSGSRCREHAHVDVTNADGYCLFDTLNREYHVSGVEQDMNDEDGKWYDRKGGLDLEAVVAVMNAFPAVAANYLSLLEENERLREALGRIERWFGEFPRSERLDRDGTEMPYGIAFGSNGERDYIRGIARAAIARADAKEAVVGVPERVTGGAGTCLCNPHAEPNAERVSYCPVHGADAKEAE